MGKREIIELDSEDATLADAAARLSASCGGLWFVGAHGITHQNGSNTTYYLLPEWMPVVTQAQSFLGSQGYEVEGIGSLGGLIRSALKSLMSEACQAGIRDSPWDGPVGHYLARPGEYPYAVLSDVSSCYYNTLRLLPSPFLICGRERLRWEHCPDGWHSLLDSLAPHKLLRNTLWGCMVGNSQGVEVFKGGKKQPNFRFKPPATRPAGLWVVGRVYCVTALAAAQTQAWYSAIDSVICDPDREPVAWSDWGYSYRVAQAGDASVVGVGAYRVGAKATLNWLQEGVKWPVPHEPHIPLDPCEWLVSRGRIRKEDPKAYSWGRWSSG